MRLLQPANLGFLSLVIVEITKRDHQASSGYGSLHVLPVIEAVALASDKSNVRGRQWYGIAQPTARTWLFAGGRPEAFGGFPPRAWLTVFLPVLCLMCVCEMRTWPLRITEVIFFQLVTSWTRCAFRKCAPASSFDAKRCAIARHLPCFPIWKLLYEVTPVLRRSNPPAD
jgi:hypothetical protein